jgi:hypothetical protein
VLRHGGDKAAPARNSRFFYPAVFAAPAVRMHGMPVSLLWLLLPPAGGRGHRQSSLAPPFRQKSCCHVHGCRRVPVWCPPRFLDAFSVGPFVRITPTGRKPSRDAPRSGLCRTNGYAEGGIRTPTPYGATPSRWCVCQFRHFRTGEETPKDYRATARAGNRSYLVAGGVAGAAGACAGAAGAPG